VLAGRRLMMRGNGDLLVASVHGLSRLRVCFDVAVLRALLAVWLSVNGVAHVNEVTLRRVGLVV